MKIQEIFTPGRFPKWTYVDSHLKDKEQHLRDALDDGSMLVSISGPSKSGKTVFVEHVLGKENLVLVTGAGIQSVTDLWIKVFDVIGTPVSRTRELSTADRSATSTSVEGEGNVFVLKGKASVSSTNESSTRSGDTEVEAIDALQLLIRELSGTDFVIFIDDFHYIPRQIQSELAQQLKEAMRNGVKFICASVPYHKDDVIRSNPDLRGRIFSIDFDYWGSDILEEIPRKGFDIANISYDPDLVSNFSSEAAGSPQLMQYLCLNACLELNVRETQDSTVELAYDDSILSSVCQRTVLSTDYGSVVERMIEGPKTRGSDRNVYISKYGWQGDVYKFFVKTLSLDPPKLNFRYQPLVDRVASICNGASPSGSSITNACSHVAAIANDAAGDNIVEWDGENDVFDIRDPYLLFYLRWSDII